MKPTWSDYYNATTAAHAAEGARPKIKPLLRSLCRVSRLLCEEMRLDDREVARHPAIVAYVGALARVTKADRDGYWTAAVDECDRRYEQLQSGEEVD
jgi:transposase InsO family protein